MGVYEERAPPNTGMHWPANTQERGSGGTLSLGCQAGQVAANPASCVGGDPQSVRDLSPCLPASMGDAARPSANTLSSSSGSSPTPLQQQHPCGHTSLHQTHCGTNNNCYDSGGATPYDSRDYGSPGDASEYRNNNYEQHPNEIAMPPQTHLQHQHHHPHHHHHHHQQAILHQSQVQQPDQQDQQHGVMMHAIPKLEPPSTPPSHQDHHQQQQQQQQHEAASGSVVVAVCAGCGLKISDRFYLQAVDRRWHAACLQCSHCRQGLDGEVTCFSRDGNIYCKKDYYRMFGSMKRCARCQAAILASELVMRARELVFHVRCFSCAACSVPLTKGDHFGMRDGAVLCRMHYELGAELHPSQSPPVPVFPPGPHYPSQSFPSPEFLHHPHHHPHHHHQPPPPSLVHRQLQPQQPSAQQQGQQQTQQSPVSLQPATPAGLEHPGAAGSPPKMAYFNGASPVVAATAVSVSTAVATVPAPRQKGRPRKRKPKDLEAMTASLGESYLNADYIDMPFGRGGPGTPGMGGSNSRTKRMRTSFKHHQLRTMKSYFAINHNPDAKDLKQLSQKTGLPKRVLQVWFQNARAKWRRMVLKQEGKSDKCGPGGGLGGPGGMDSGSLSELELYASSAGSGGPPMSPQFVLGGPHSPASLGSLDCA